MKEVIGPIDLLHGVCIYGRRAYELAPTMAMKLKELRPIAIDIRSWDWGERVGHEAIGGRLLEWLDLDLLAEGFSAGLGIQKGAVSALLNRFYRMTPSPTLFGLSGFLDSFETLDLQMRGAAERVKEVVVSLSTMGRAKGLPEEGPAFIDLSKVGWDAPRCILYAALLRRFSSRPPKVPLILSGLEVLGRSYRLWGLVEGLFRRVPLIAFCDGRPPLNFFMLVRVEGEEFEVERGGIYFSRGRLKLERVHLDQEGVRGDLSFSREAYMVLKALEKDESTIEGLKGYLPTVAVEEIIFILEGGGHVERRGNYVRITEMGLRHLEKLEEAYG